MIYLLIEKVLCGASHLSGSFPFISKPSCFVVVIPHLLMLSRLADTSIPDSETSLYHLCSPTNQTSTAWPITLAPALASPEFCFLDIGNVVITTVKGFLYFPDQKIRAETPLYIESCYQKVGLHRRYLQLKPTRPRFCHHRRDLLRIQSLENRVYSGIENLDVSFE